MPVLSLLFAAALAADDPQPGQPCLPSPSEASISAPSGIDEHRALRAALNEPMPQGTMLVTLYGKGGHLATTEYSIILARDPGGSWQGTAVGRSRIWVEGAPFRTTPKAEWTLVPISAQQLENALERTCPDAPSTSDTSTPPPLGYVSETMVVQARGQEDRAFYVGETMRALAALMRQPETGERGRSSIP